MNLVRIFLINSWRNTKAQVACRDRDAFWKDTNRNNLAEACFSVSFPDFYSHIFFFFFINSKIILKEISIKTLSRIRCRSLVHRIESGFPQSRTTKESEWTTHECPLESIARRQLSPSVTVKSECKVSITITTWCDLRVLSFRFCRVSALSKPFGVFRFLFIIFLRKIGSLKMEKRGTWWGEDHVMFIHTPSMTESADVGSGVFQSGGTFGRLPVADVQRPILVCVTTLTFCHYWWW